MAVSKLLLCVALAGGCATVQPPGPVSVPLPKRYTCDQERAASVAWPTLPETIREMMGDYHTERVTLGRLSGAAGAPPCVK